MIMSFAVMILKVCACTIGSWDVSIKSFLHKRKVQGKVKRTWMMTQTVVEIVIATTLILTLPKNTHLVVPNNAIWFHQALCLSFQSILLLTHTVPIVTNQWKDPSQISLVPHYHSLIKGIMSTTVAWCWLFLSCRGLVWSSNSRINHGMMHSQPICFHHSNWR